MKYRLSFLGFLLAFIPFQNMAQKQADTTAYKTHFTPLPNIGYSPDTRLVLGALVLAQFKLKKAETDTRPSNIMASAAITFKEQTTFEAYNTLVFPEEKWIWNGAVFFQHWPISYWGVGIDTEDDDEITIDYRNIAFEQSFYKRIKNGLYAGPKVHFRYMYDVSFQNEDDESIEAPKVTGAHGSTNLGIGFGGTWDRRNSILTPTANHYVEFSVLFYSTNWFGDFSFQSYLLDARKYLNFNTDGKSVLAFQTLFRSNHGEVPFREMALLGGNRIMRGYIEGRYRDKTGIQLQTEYRQRVMGRFGFAVFGALGNVAPDIGSFEWDRTKWAVGAGMRYNINKKDPTYLRLDYGIGQNTDGFYITLGEAF